MMRPEEQPRPNVLGPAIGLRELIILAIVIAVFSFVAVITAIAFIP
jgi:hypothetical protein